MASDELEPRDQTPSSAKVTVETNATEIATAKAALLPKSNYANDK